MPIRVLSPEVAAQIAAGEVVERPASVAKELVENSLDAGATQVIVEAQGGGVALLRVTDNGSGIPADEVALAFERHATSKLTSARELERIATLGFRGEALASIAAVARVRLETRTHDSQGGHFIELEGGRATGQGPCGCPPGTSIWVKDLFGEVPARRKFLKSAGAESARIVDILSRMAMAYLGVRFRALIDGRQVLSTPGTGKLEDALSAVYGADMAGQLLALEWEGEGYRVAGYASPPSLTRANRSYVTLIVNRRVVQSRTLGFALEQAYHGLLQQGRYPLAVVHLTLPCEQVDVNVHPTKREVRFRDEDRAFSAVQRAARAALVADSPVQSIGVTVPVVEPPDVPTPQPEPPGFSLSMPSTQLRLSPSAPPPERDAPTPRESLARLRVLGQMGTTYIVAEGRDGLYLIDQHAAHERVLYERVRGAADARMPETQALLEPATVDLTAEQAALARDMPELLARYGFLIEPFGEGAYLLRGVPSVTKKGEPAASLREVLDLMLHEGRLKEREEKLAASIACHSAVRAGMEMGFQEMAALVRLLEASQAPNTCPHGRPTMVRVSATYLEREFGRR